MSEAQDFIKAPKRVVPIIYAYTTPQVANNNGFTKIGYTENDVGKRIGQQTHTANIQWNLEWSGNAIYDDGSGEMFHDTDFHAYLTKSGVERNDSTEWFRVSGKKSHDMFNDFRSNRGVAEDAGAVVPYHLRDEQEKAVDQTISYRNGHEKGEFLWNAKPRFGKTLSVYDFCKKIKALNVLIVTNRPAIANSWYSDYEKFMGTESGYRFVSSTDSLSGKRLVVSREEYVSLNLTLHPPLKCIEFVSLQDLKGSRYFGGRFDKLKEVSDIKWDVLVIDEAHEGVDTYKTDVAFDRIKRKFTLHLSGTPFKALANNKFNDDAIYNWTYADEQAAKRDFKSDPTADAIVKNPYEDMPKLHLLTYRMSDIIRDELQQGVEINGETEEYAFDLNEFFETKNGRFVHESSVDKFLNALTEQKRYPFSTEELRGDLKHTFWLLNRVDSAKALAKKLERHPVFSGYKIILAAGDGNLDDDEETRKSFDKVRNAIKNYDRTITLSVGQLTTGVTIPEWTGVLMLANIKSPSLYMQAAFRAQNPCLFHYPNSGFYRKKDAYVFDFDPARTLIIFDEFANDLSENTSAGKGDSDTRKENIKRLLNFFPVIGEDDEGEMVELDAENVLSIPRKIKSQEVVRRGFMSNFLFQNISNIFGAPQEVLDIINNFQPVTEPQGNIEVTPEMLENLSLDEDGNVHLNADYVDNKTEEVFGSKIFGEIPDDLNNAVKQFETDGSGEDAESLEKLKDRVHVCAVAPILEAAKSKYGENLRSSDAKRIEKKLRDASDLIINKAHTNYGIEQNNIEKERAETLSRINDDKARENAIQDFDKRLDAAKKELNQAISTSLNDFFNSAKKDTIETVETSIKVHEKSSIEDQYRDHLRGFVRTIPSFLMAYGDDSTTLETIDKAVPEQVFKDVTSTTLDEFRFLRDGGNYTDKETGEDKYYPGHLFDPIVFDDSIKEFMNLKTKLADYFDESHTEDIFDYIPPQRTNQIYTPKAIVRKMVNMLEEENPGCFDKPDKTFIDLYMKSGLYITEIVKRLYRSAKMKKRFPDKAERLNHIFAEQVYGLAPSEIIYKIATNYILGFSDETAIEKNNFRQCDALIYAKEGTLEKKLDELFGRGKHGR